MDAADPFLVILTALELEYSAVRQTLTGLRTFSHEAGTLFEIGRLADSNGAVAVAMTGPGNRGAAVLAERAIATFGPRALLFAGIAGALHDHLAIGDIVVATRVYSYQGGKSADDAFLSRPRSWDAPHELEQLARRVARTQSWSAGLGLDVPPAVHFAPIAAGEVVLDSRISSVAEHLRRLYNDAAAVEMESAGVAEAGHLNRALPVLAVRGISDKADGRKLQADRDGSRSVAAAHAAAFAAALAREMLLFPDGTATVAPSADPAAAQIIISGNATVHKATVLGDVHGEVSF